MNEKKSIDFEGELKRLNEIVERIEGNVLPLEEAIKLYEDGCKIIKNLETALKNAENKMASIIDTDKISSGK